MRKSKSRHRQPMLLKILKDNERFRYPVAQELSRCAGASILWVGHVFLMGLCQPALQEVFSGSIFHLEWKEGLEQAHVLHMCLEVALMILKSVRAMGHRDFCPAARGRKSILDQTWPRHVHHSFPNCLRCLMCSALLSQT